MKSRREFLKKTALAGGLASLGRSSVFGLEGEKSYVFSNGESLIIEPGNKSYFEPLEFIRIKGTAGGTVRVLDGAGNVYFESEESDNIEFRISGVLGYHQVLKSDRKGRIIDKASFPVDCKTRIVDSEGEFSEFFNTLVYTLMGSGGSSGVVKRMNGKLYTTYSSWFQDHMYATLGLRYFCNEMKSGVDLYTEGQREDGMIHDNYKHKWEINGAWSRRFDYGNFVTVPDDPSSTAIFVRVPVENMAEFTYLESVYMAWKITGHDDWMKSKLNSMLRAMNYTLTDPYRWSEKFQLTKRGYTIDIWDFQSRYDTKISGDTMRVYLDKSRFGILYADNVRFAQSCAFLSEMLEYAGRKDESVKVMKIAIELKERIDRLSWNGDFYRHWVPEDPDIERDFGGVDESKQVTLSNTWILNRGLLSHQQIVSIIKTYFRIKTEMPDSSPGEWYCCYPPFDKGWSAEKWNYMNGGVSPIAAGELALGCFNHGYESYGVDILRRVNILAGRSGKRLHGCYKGAIEKEPERSFKNLDLRQVANADIKGDGKRPAGVAGWTGEGDNDLHEFPTGEQVFKDIPFDIIRPEDNGRRSVLALSAEEGYKRTAEITINDHIGSLYFLHCIGNGSIAGNITWNYSDGSSVTKYISALSGKGAQKGIENWWTPDIPETRESMQVLHTAWTGKNNHNPKIGIFIFGMNNPVQGKEVESVILEGQKDNTKWMILGLTTSDVPVYFEPGIVSTIPEHWAAAECLYSMIEGLAGIVNTGTAFNRAKLAPKWVFAGTDMVHATAKYEASNGYLSYIYQKNKNGYQVEFTGSAERTRLELPIPEGKIITGLFLDKKPIDYQVFQVEKTHYVRFDSIGYKTRTVRVQLKS